MNDAVVYPVESEVLWRFESLRMEEFSPLTERLEKENPELAVQLAVLRNNVCAADFDKYIQELVSLKKVGNTLFLLTQHGMQRSLINHMFIPMFKEAFAVTDVRVLSQK